VLSSLPQVYEEARAKKQKKMLAQGQSRMHALNSSEGQAKIEDLSVEQREPQSSDCLRSQGVATGE